MRIKKSISLLEKIRICKGMKNRIRIRSRCKWFELGEKSTKFFLNLEKH